MCVAGGALNSIVIRRSYRLLDVKASRRHDLLMSTAKRATVYFDPEVHKALRLRAAASDQSISDMVNDAVRASLAEDAADLAAFDARKRERSVSFDSFVQGMKRRGVI
jgi:plasmid stability protein